MADSYMNLSPGEQVILSVRRHIVNLFPVIAATVLVVILVFLGLEFVASHQQLFPAGIVGAINTGLVILAAVMLIILVLAYLVFNQNKLILTNLHLIIVNQAGLFGREVSKLALDEIQDVHGVRRGVFATLLNYGQVEVETAGEMENFTFKPVSDCLDLASRINDQHEQFEREHGVLRGLEK